MAHYKISSVRSVFSRVAGESSRMVLREATKSMGARLPPSSLESLTERAFLRIYCSFEIFLEESFILYVAGGVSASRKAIKSILDPPNRKKAEEFIREGRPYADWSDVSKVQDRADRYFIHNNPFAPLRSWQTQLERIRKIRNAIAHSSQKSKLDFGSVVRDELGSQPLNCTVGSFLLQTKIKIAPPISHFEHYIDLLKMVTTQIAA